MVRRHTSGKCVQQPDAPAASRAPASSTRPTRGCSPRRACPRTPTAGRGRMDRARSVCRVMLPARRRALKGGRAGNAAQHRSVQHRNTPRAATHLDGRHAALVVRAQRARERRVETRGARVIVRLPAPRVVQKEEVDVRRLQGRQHELKQRCRHVGRAALYVELGSNPQLLARDARRRDGCSDVRLRAVVDGGVNVRTALREPRADVVAAAAAALPDDGHRVARAVGARRGRAQLHRGHGGG